MQFRKLVLSALAATTAAAQNMSLAGVLGGNQNLTSLTSLVSSYPGLLATLGNATNITLLAPSNQALGALLNSSAGMQAASMPGFIQALL